MNYKSKLLLLNTFVFFTSALFSQQLEWVEQFGMDGKINITGMEIDRHGNIYMLGDFQGTCDFDLGVGQTVITTDDNDQLSKAFILKLDSRRNLIWHKQFNVTGSLNFNALRLDPQGALYASGTFHGFVDFDSGPGEYNRASDDTADSFILKLNEEGELHWLAQYSELSLGAQAPLIDQAGNIYFSGILRGSNDFDPGTAMQIYNPIGEQDLFISKLNEAGEFQWTYQLGEQATEFFAPSLALSHLGELVVTTQFIGEESFDVDNGTEMHIVHGSGNIDGLALQINNEGQFIDGIYLGDDDSEVNLARVVVDDYGDFILFGSYTGTFDVHPGEAEEFISSEEAYSMFMIKMDAAANYVWTKEFKASLGVIQENEMDVAVDADRNIYVSASFDGALDLNPGPAIDVTSSNESEDIFTAKLDPHGELMWSQVFSGPGNVLHPKLVVDIDYNIYHSGIFTGTVDFSPGAATTELTAQEFSSDVYLLKLSQCRATQSSLSMKACDSYTSPSGDYTWTESGEYIDVVANDRGCDSIIVIDLVINSINKGIEFEEEMFFAKEEDADYQWIDVANNNTVIEGATTRTFSPLTPGTYAVEISQSGCQQLSEPKTIVPKKMEENIFDDGIKVYPNPTLGNIQIDLDQIYDEVEMSIYNMNGQTVYTQQYNTIQSIKYQLDNNPGIYFLHLNQNNHKKIVRLVKS